GPGADRRGSDRDRPRRPGAPVDLPRDRAFPPHRRAPRRAVARGSAGDPAGTSRSSLRVLRGVCRRSHRPQAHRLVLPGTGRSAGTSVPPAGDAGRIGGSTEKPRGEILLRQGRGLGGTGSMSNRGTAETLSAQEESDVIDLNVVRGLHAASLRECAANALDRYFDELDGHVPANLYALVINEVEEPLLRAVLRFTRGNQSRAAEILGINRSTLRKKLRAQG